MLYSVKFILMSRLNDDDDDDDDAYYYFYFLFEGDGWVQHLGARKGERKGRRGGTFT